MGFAQRALRQRQWLELLRPGFHFRPEGRRLGGARGLALFRGDLPRFIFHAVKFPELADKPDGLAIALRRCKTCAGCLYVNRFFLIFLMCF